MQRVRKTGLAALIRWREGPVLAAIIASAFSDAGPPVLVAEGLFILAYLLLADAPPRPVSWLRHQVPLVVAGIIATGTALARVSNDRGFRVPACRLG